MSWESTAVYYRLANELVRERLGGMHSGRIVLDSVDFADIEALQVSAQWEAAGRVLAARARALELAGADCLLICTNTMHLVVDQIETATSIPVLHIADTTAAAARAAGATRVGLLGTAFTMEQDFYRDRLAAHGLDVIVPDADDRALVHRVIYDELVRGVVSEESRAAYRRVIDRLVERGAEGIILGCTEIELLVGPDDSPVPVFPTTRIHVEAAVDFALDDSGPTASDPASASDASLDGRIFAAVAEVEGGEVGPSTHFHYAERDGVVQAEYAGGAIRRGHLIGTRDGDRVEFRYAQLAADGSTSTGHCVSRVEQLPDGRLRMHETWEWESRPGSGTSIVEEVA